MNKSVLQIAGELVEACPYTANMKQAHRLLLASMIAEELSRQRKEGYAAGFSATYREPPGMRHGGT